MAGSFAPFLQFDAVSNGIRSGYNDEGIADAADYLVWHDKLDTSCLTNEEVSPTTVDIADYLCRRDRFGATTPGRAGALSSVAAVPEPITLSLVLASIVGIYWGVAVWGVGVDHSRHGWPIF